MRALRQVEGSVLWLPYDNAAAADNLRRHAEARGVAAGRLRSRCASSSTPISPVIAWPIVLDTFPVNAHTTASDALWTGLPLITLGRDLVSRGGEPARGRRAGRLVTDSPLTTKRWHSSSPPRPRAGGDQGKAAGWAREIAPFDTDRFRRHIESAYSPCTNAISAPRWLVDVAAIGCHGGRVPLAPPRT
jgi:hypothetical protein